jgi:glycosyltransferase involved in cell wall biosynthesis
MKTLTALATQPIPAPIPVSVVIPTLNEADRLPACLDSVRWAADVIVVDAGSSDATRDVARAHGARVIEMTGRTIGAQKNQGIAHARHPWILSIDADERVTPELEAAIARAVSSPSAAAFRVHLFNHYLGAPFDRGGWARDRHVRLFPSHWRWTEQRVHERLIVEGPVADLDGRLAHDSYRDLAHQLAKATTYARWGADDLVDRGVSVRWTHLVLRPVWRFTKTFLFEGMWREGARGFVFCAVHAWSCFAKYALAWDLRRRAQSTTVSDAPHAADPVPLLSPHRMPAAWRGARHELHHAGPLRRADGSARAAGVFRRDGA